MVGRLIEQQNLGAIDELSGESEATSLTTAQLGDLTNSRRIRIESEPVKHSVDPRGQLVATFSLEPFEVAVVFREHLRR